MNYLQIKHAFPPLSNIKEFSCHTFNGMYIIWTVVIADLRHTILGSVKPDINFDIIHRNTMILNLTQK